MPLGSTPWVSSQARYSTRSRSERMADELLSLRLIVVSPSPGGRALFRNAAAVARVPIELVENDGEAAAGRSLAAGADLAFFDTALGGEAVARMGLGGPRRVEPALYRRARRACRFQVFSDGRSGQPAGGRGRCAPPDRRLDPAPAAEPRTVGGRFADHAQHRAQGAGRNTLPARRDRGGRRRTGSPNCGGRSAIRALC